ncbi:hypothetical protein [Pseudomonas faucium]|uniref:hypothetical protein n=1 Tax=Pseudomonas faucium TaxID=2740518 RepID=UPI0039C49B94
MSKKLMEKGQKAKLLEYLEKEIDGAAQKIIKLKDRQDHFAFGQIQVFMTFRRILSDTVTDELIEPPAQRTDLDRGALSALDRILVQLGLIEHGALIGQFESQLTAQQKRVASSPVLASDMLERRAAGDGKDSLTVASDLDRAKSAAAAAAARQPKPQPVSAELKAFVEAQINSAAKKIIDKKKVEFDHFATGQLGYLLTLRRWVEGTSTPEDLGLHDALNDVLQKGQVVSERSSYLKALL